MRTKLYLCAALALSACADKPPAQVAIDAAPDWYTKPPSDEGAIYVTGMSTSGDMQFAIDKATLNATAILADRLKGETSVLLKSHTVERGHIAVSSNEKTVKKVAKAETAGYEVENTSIVALGTQFRVFVLIKYVPNVDEGADKAFDELKQETGKEPPAPAASPEPTVQSEPV